jgi:hypothetical protein
MVKTGFGITAALMKKGAQSREGGGGVTEFAVADSFSFSYSGI